MEPAQISGLLAVNMTKGPHVARCAAVLQDSTIRCIGFGTKSARDVLGLWRIREESLASAGIAAEGLEEALGALGSLGHNALVQVFAFTSERDLAWVFVSVQDQRLVGCFVKAKRGHRSAPAR